MKSTPNNTLVTAMKKDIIVAVMFCYTDNMERKGDGFKHSVGELAFVRKGDIEYVEKETVGGEKYIEPKITEQMYNRLDNGLTNPYVRQMDTFMMTKKDLNEYVEHTERKIELMQMNLANAYKYYKLVG